MLKSKGYSVLTRRKIRDSSLNDLFFSQWHAVSGITHLLHVALSLAHHRRSEGRPWESFCERPTTTQIARRLSVSPVDVEKSPLETRESCMHAGGLRGIFHSRDSRKRGVCARAPVFRGKEGLIDWTRWSRMGLRGWASGGKNYGMMG